MPKREDENWLSWKRSNLRYCPICNRFVSESDFYKYHYNKCFEPQSLRSLQQAPKLYHCPKCKRDSLFKHPKSGRYECLNRDCQAVFAATYVVEPAKEYDSQPYMRTEGQAESGHKIGNCPRCGSSKFYYSRYHKMWQCLSCHLLTDDPRSAMVTAQSKDETQKTKHGVERVDHKIANKLSQYRYQLIARGYLRRLLSYVRGSIRRFKRRTWQTRRKFWRIFILLAVLATIAIVLSAVGLSISGDVSLAAGVVISVVGLGILYWSLSTLSKHRPKLPSLVMVLLISVIFIMFSSAYMDIRSLTDIKNAIVGGFTTEEGEFRSVVEAFVERAKLAFVEVTEDIIEEIEEVSNSKHVYVDGAVLVGADGHWITLENNPDAIDPTWAGLKDFLASDTTDRQTYSFSSFVCADFAEMLHNNAEAAGIRAAYVVVDLGPSAYYPMSGGHALNAFDTTDRGLVYIDCTAPIENYGGSADKVVSVEVGQPYLPESIFPQVGWSWLSMGMIEEIEVIQW